MREIGVRPRSLHPGGSTKHLSSRRQAVSDGDQRSVCWSSVALFGSGDDEAEQPSVSRLEHARRFGRTFLEGNAKDVA